ncbi:MAG: glycosyltransferase family 1 protein [Sulfitobacter sp.]
MADLLLNARFLMRAPTGVDRTATELVSALLELPHAPTLRALRPGGAIANEPDRPPSLLAVTSVLPSQWPGQLWEQITLNSMRPDDWMLSLCNMGPVRRKRQIVMIHDAQVFRQPQSYSRMFRAWYNVLQPRLGHRASRVLTVSEHSRSEILHFGLAPADRIDVIPNGADHILRIAPDPETLTRHRLQPGGYLLAIGSIAPHKNLPFLVNAARARQNRDMPLVIAGGGNATIFGAEGIAASEDVRILGRVSEGELRALYNNARALVFPSITEGFGLPAAEAMACGCPVIASTGGAIPEVCGDSTILLDPGDTAGWTHAMDTIASDDALCDRLSRQGRNRAASMTWRASAERLVKILMDLDNPH